MNKTKKKKVVEVTPVKLTEQGDIEVGPSGFQTADELLDNIDRRIEKAEKSKKAQKKKVKR